MKKARKQHRKLAMRQADYSRSMAGMPVAKQMGYHKPGSSKK